MSKVCKIISRTAVKDNVKDVFILTSDKSFKIIKIENTGN